MASDELALEPTNLRIICRSPDILRSDETPSLDFEVRRAADAEARGANSLQREACLSVDIEVVIGPQFLGGFGGKSIYQRKENERDAQQMRRHAEARGGPRRGSRRGACHFRVVYRPITSRLVLLNSQLRPPDAAKEQNKSKERKEREESKNALIEAR
ncbi:hypothetical protein K438DRAFT_1783573 [Mycena galopus ATCC 62051]|nr:hypothetical protein K438DRAFT_1783573 [Mycena galopus ATCC 62051]